MFSVKPHTVQHFYAFGSVSLADLILVCESRKVFVSFGRLLVIFKSEQDRDAFEWHCAHHNSAAIRAIKRVPESAEVAS